MERLLMTGWTEEKRRMLSLDVSLLFGNICKIIPMAMTISPGTSLQDVHVIFTMLRCDHCYVTHQGELAGVVTTKTVLDAGGNKTS
jgi:chloride channel 2